MFIIDIKVSAKKWFSAVESGDKTNFRQKDCIKREFNWLSISPKFSINKYVIVETEFTILHVRK